MKHFIFMIPLQEPAKLNKTHYNSSKETAFLVNDKKTCFPITVPVENCIKSGEKVKFTVIRTNHVNEPENFETFKRELNEIKDKIGFEYEINEIKTEYDESADTQSLLLENLIDSFEDDDKIYIDVTFGAKPMPMIMMIAAAFAISCKKDCLVDAIIYGQFNFADHTASIYDVSYLLYLNNVVNNLGKYEPDKAKEMLHDVLSD